MTNSERGIATRRLVYLGMLAAISVLLVYFIHFPIIPALPFLEYEPADIAILLGTLMFGPVSGLLLTLVAAILQGVTVSAGSGFIGILMHIFATGSMALTVGLITRKKTSRLVMVLALVAGVIVMTGVMTVWNVIITPIYMGVERSQVVDMLMTGIVPFNLIKAGVNSAFAGVIYRAVRPWKWLGNRIAIERKF